MKEPSQQSHRLAVPQNTNSAAAVLIAYTLAIINLHTQAPRIAKHISRRQIISQLLYTHLSQQQIITRSMVIDLNEEEDKSFLLIFN